VEFTRSGTEPLYIEFRERTVAKTRDLDDNSVLDVDAAGNIGAMTAERASDRTGIRGFSHEQLRA